MIEFFSNKKSSGFSLIELILVLAVISTVAVATVPLYRTQQTGIELDVAIDVVAQHMRRAQVLSQAVKDNSEWGLKIHNTSTVVFKGSDYDARDESFDEFTGLPDGFVTSGVTEIYFDRFSGNPNITGTLTITSEEGTNRFITINSVGMIAYD